MTDRAGILPWPDQRLWVTLRPEWTPEPDLRWLIEGSAHTHRGHLYVSANGGRLRVTVHPGDISGGSPEAWLWIDGFLRGQEAHLFEFLGGSVDLLDDHDEDDIARWLAWNERFRRHEDLVPALRNRIGITIGDGVVILSPRAAGQRRASELLYGRAESVGFLREHPVGDKHHLGQC